MVVQKHSRDESKEAAVPFQYFEILRPVAGPALQQQIGKRRSLFDERYEVIQINGLVESLVIMHSLSDQSVPGDLENRLSQIR